MDSDRIRYADVLRNRNFSFLWVGQIISNFGDRFTYMANMALIVFNWGGSAMETGGMFIAMSLPAIVLGPIAGVFVDRYNKKKVMILCDLARAAIVPLLIFADSLIQVYIIVFFISSISRFFYPARSAMIPSIVKREQLLVANSLSNSTYEFSAIAGYAIGGMLVGILGVKMVFIIDSISFLVSALFILMVYFVPIKKNITMTGNTIGRIVEELKSGVRYSYVERRVLFILLLLGSAILAFAGINILWVILIRDVMGMGIEGMGALESVFGGGMLIGTFVVGFIGHKYRNKRLILSGFGVSSLSLLMIGLIPLLAPVLFFAFLAGAFISFVNIPTVTVLQKVVPEDMLGRVFALLGTMTESAGVISMVAIGFLADIFPVQSLIVGLSLALLMVTIVGFMVPVELETDDVIPCEE